jgi:hypothetical protein
MIKKIISKPKRAGMENALLAQAARPSKFSLKEGQNERRNQS